MCEEHIVQVLLVKPLQMSRAPPVAREARLAIVNGLDPSHGTDLSLDLVGGCLPAAGSLGRLDTGAADNTVISAAEICSHRFAKFHYTGYFCTILFHY